MEYERKWRVKDDSEVSDLNNWGNDDAIYGHGKDFEMIMGEGVYVKQNKGYVLGIYW